MLLDLNFASSQHLPNDFQVTPVTSASSKDLDRRKLQVGFALLFGAAQHAPLQNVLPRKYMMQLNDVQTLKT